MMENDDSSLDGSTLAVSSTMMTTWPKAAVDPVGCRHVVDRVVRGAEVRTIDPALAVPAVARGPGWGPGLGGGWGDIRNLGPSSSATMFGRARARRGNVRSAILTLLAEKPHNGYQIMQAIEQRSNGAWKPSSGSIYPTLQQLEDEGLVETEEAKPGQQAARATSCPRRASATSTTTSDELEADWAPDEEAGA